MITVQTELHRHLDCSLRTQTLLSLAQEQGLEAQSTSLRAFEEKLILREPLSDLRSVLAQFTLFQKVLTRPEILERVAFEVVEDCWNEGTRQVELRYSPSFVSEFNRLSWVECLEAFERGIQRARSLYPSMKTGLICIASRDFGVEQVDQTIEFFLSQSDRFVGIDLAGNEGLFPCRLFEPSFRKAAAQGAQITIHAGEAAGPDSVWEAIELLHAKRIGHGIASIQDPQLMDYLKTKEICLEMCPTSNWITQTVPSLEAHPLPRVLREGVPVCISTDDPGIFGSSLVNEIGICLNQMKMSPNEVEKCHSHALKASFIKK